MTGALEGLTFKATAGCIALIAAAAFGLIIYATITFVGVLQAASAQALSSLLY